MEVGNITTVAEFVLLRLSNNPQIQVVLFLLFLVIYLLTLTGNLLMLLVIRADSHLHTPMYFFLGHLSFLDAFYSSIVVPNLLENLLSKWKTISLLQCFTQISLVIFSGATEACLLSVMAYDRFQAVCHPLLYMVAMNRKVCTGLVGASWAIGIGTGLVNTLLLAQQRFCGPNLIHSFSCELPPVLLLACSDPYISIASILTTMVVLGLGTLVLLLGSYTRIIMTALRINSATGRSKIFSTCSSHFLVVTIFYGSGIFRAALVNVLHKITGVWRHLKIEMSDFSLIISSFLDAATSESQLSSGKPLCRVSGMGWTVAANSIAAIALSLFYSFVQFPSRYMTPASDSALKQVLSMQYSVVTPLLNPFIYSLKNQEVKAALKRMLARKPRLTF